MQVLTDHIYKRVSTLLESHGLGHFSDLSSAEQITLLEEAHREISSEDNKVNCLLFGAVKHRSQLLDLTAGDSRREQRFFEIAFLLRRGEDAQGECFGCVFRGWRVAIDSAPASTNVIIEKSRRETPTLIVRSTNKAPKETSSSTRTFPVHALAR